VSSFKPSQKPWTVLSSGLFIATSALMLTACAPLTPRYEGPQIQASLRQNCPPLAEVRDGTAGTVLRWGVGAAQMYRECADRHKALVQAINDAGVQ